MRKRFTKIICAFTALIAALGITSVSACADTYNTKPLKGNIFTQNAAVSNGGFAVQKGEYIYFINGVEQNTAVNTFGDVVKGAIMRISENDLSDRRYSSAETVVPQIAYSGSKNAGIYIYGDYIYYSTPSTEKNSDGQVLNSNLAFKRARLDGTGAMRDYFVQFPDSSYEYRFVEVDGTVYLLYVAANEDLYGTGASYTNIHSVNCETGVDTLLAYNVVSNSVTFDKTNPENPGVFYLMQVRDLLTGSTESAYNQVYTVRADATTSPREYDFSEIKDYDADKDPVYVNLGTLVLDGIGKPQAMAGNVTQFNATDDGAAAVTNSPYIYALSAYQNNTLFYTRTTSGDTTQRLFALKESRSYKPVSGNPVINECLTTEGSAASNYTYLFEGDELSSVLISDSNGLLKASVEGGKITSKTDNDNRFYVTSGTQPTVLFLDNNYIYYSVSGGNGYSINRVNYTGNYENYNRFTFESDGVTEYTSVKVLDLDASSDWYKPEMFGGQLLFATVTANMTDYNYIMACDLRNGNGAVMSNAEISELNDKYDGIEKAISEIDEDNYQNLQNALRYGFHTADAKYLTKLINAYVEIQGSDEEKFWSKQSVEKYADFIAAKGDWADYKDTKKVNGEDVAANKRDYYYAVVGHMSEADEEAYIENLRTTYLQAWPEKEGGWFDGLSDGAKAGFIIGVVAGGLLIIAAAVIVTLIVIRKRKEKLPEYTKKRIKVDTTDDRDIDVYSDEDAQNTEQE